MFGVWDFCTFDGLKVSGSYRIYVSFDVVIGHGVVRAGGLGGLDCLEVFRRVLTRYHCSVLTVIHSPIHPNR